MKSMGKKGVNSISSDPFEEYKRESDSTKRGRSYVWHTADWHVFED